MGGLPYEEQTDENRHRVIEKLRLSSDKDFQGGKPLFETLTDGDGLREIRFSAYGVLLEFYLKL